MKLSMHKFGHCLVFFFCMVTGNAQENITVSGGTLSGIDGVVSYSIGQLFFDTFSGTNGSITQGVQQPYEIFPVAIMNESDLICSVYPNPTSDILFLHIDNSDLNNLFIQVIDIQGKILDNQRIASNVFEVGLSGYEPGTYFLKLIVIDQVAKVFKIVKK